jgi:putative PIN family toxin of toxin-antitoxin system
LRIVLDTNVLVSGLLSPAGPPGRILDLVTAQHVAVLFDDRIIAEYHDVLARPRLRIQPAEADALLAVIQQAGIPVVARPLDVVLPDGDDVTFFEVAVEGRADALVTGNERHFTPVKGDPRVAILNPADFVSRWLQRER